MLGLCPNFGVALSNALPGFARGHQRDKVPLEPIRRWVETWERSSGERVGGLFAFGRLMDLRRQKGDRLLGSVSLVPPRFVGVAIVELFHEKAHIVAEFVEILRFDP